MLSGGSNSSTSSGGVPLDLSVKAGHLFSAISSDLNSSGPSLAGSAPSQATSYLNIYHNPRLAGIVRNEGSVHRGAQHVPSQPHSPGSPFPEGLPNQASLAAFSQTRRSGVNGPEADVSHRPPRPALTTSSSHRSLPHLAPSTPHPPALAIPTPRSDKLPQLPTSLSSCSPTSVASPLAAFLSCSSEEGGSTPGRNTLAAAQAARTQRQLHAPAAAPAPQAHACCHGTHHAAHHTAPHAAQQPAAALGSDADQAGLDRACLAPPPPPPTTLLAVNPALPVGMRRGAWCLEDYNVVRRLYKGATSSVYKATCLRSGLPVALKVYFLARVPPNTLHMVRREIELHAPLSHPHVVALYGAFLQDGRVVLVQEYAARGDLFHLVRSMGGRLSEQQVSELVMRPFLDAVAYLHARGICHRDIKPENILYTDRWVLKLADFGVSIDLNVERAVTRAGTLDYMAPEVSRCPLKAEPHENKDDPSLAYTFAVDVWAAGVLAYELLVGFTPVVAPPLPTNAASAPHPTPGAHAGAGGVGSFLASEATSKSLHFPASLSSASRRFILSALSEEPRERPSAKQLLFDPWVMGDSGYGTG